MWLFLPPFAKNKTAGAVQLSRKTSLLDTTPPKIIKMSKSHQKNVVAKISCCDVQLLSHRYQH